MFYSSDQMKDILNEERFLNMGIFLIKVIFYSDKFLSHLLDCLLNNDESFEVLRKKKNSLYRKEKIIEENKTMKIYVFF